MRHIARHLTYANVMVTILAFLVLGGGTAVAAFVVSSNSQIGPGTIYGHNAPAGKNKNVVADSLTGTDVKESTLGQVPSAANGARRIDYNDAAGDPAPVKVLGLDELTLKAQCEASGGTNSTLHIYVASTVDSDINYAFERQQESGQPDAVENGRGISANGSVFLDDLQLFGGPGVDRAEGQLVYHNANRVIALTLHAVANGDSGRCQVTGVAVPAPS